MQYKKTTAILLAVLAAAFYAVNVPVSKLLLKEISYISGITAVFRCRHRHRTAVLHQPKKPPRREKTDTQRPAYTLGMILLDFAAPILLMLGLKSASSANASLLGNFEIVATTLIALLLFREKVSKRLWAAILLITLSSGILSFEDMSSLHFSRGSLLVLTAAAAGDWRTTAPTIFPTKYFRDRLSQGHLFRTGFVSHCSVHRRAVPRTAHCCCGTASGICCLRAEYFLLCPFPDTLGAAKTSAYYAIAPFIGTALSCIIWHDALTVQYFLALAVMLLGSVLVVLDTLQMEHTHSHTHTFTHTHDGVTHTHTITHSHPHFHGMHGESHQHRHTMHTLLRSHNSLQHR